MKSIITTLAIFISIIAQAQIEKGTMSIGTALDGNYDRGVNNYQFNNVTSYNWGFKLTPTFEYFVKNNLSVGVGVGYGIQQNIRYTDPITELQYPSTIQNTIENYSVSLFVRKFWTVNKKLGVYFQPKLSSFYNETTNKNKVDNPAFPENLRTAYSYSNNWNHNLNLNAGVHYFFSPKWSLKAETLVSQANITKSTQTFRLFYTNINLTFGINYFFGKK